MHMFLQVVMVQHDRTSNLKFRFVDSVNL